MSNGASEEEIAHLAAVSNCRSMSCYGCSTGLASLYQLWMKERLQLKDLGGFQPRLNAKFLGIVFQSYEYDGAKGLEFGVRKELSLNS